jgi:hypothetical protein
MMRKRFWIVFFILVIYTFGIRGSLISWMILYTPKFLELRLCVREIIRCGILIILSFVLCGCRVVYLVYWLVEIWRGLFVYVVLCWFSEVFSVDVSCFNFVIFTFYFGCCKSWYLGLAWVFDYTFTICLLVEVDLDFLLIFVCRVF